MQIVTEKKYLSKKVCLNKANEISLLNNDIQMSALDIAKEIYAHAVLYYKFNKGYIKNYITKHCEIIDLEKGGDKPFRKMIYNFIWNY